MRAHPSSRRAPRGARSFPGRRARRGSLWGRDEVGLSLIEVVVAFTILLIAMIPLTYLFINEIVAAGQTGNQQTALSIAESWVETLSNSTPPADPATGAVIVDKALIPSAPSATTSATTVAAASANKAINSVTSITVASTSGLAAATAAVPQVAFVTIGSATDQITYTALTSTVITCQGTCSTASDVLTTSSTVSQNQVATPTETRGGTTYTLSATYKWAASQNAGASSKPNLCASGTPQLLAVTVQVSWGPNADTNSVKDTVMINYPPSGVETLGFIALQLLGDTTANDAQGNPWSERVTAPTVTFSGPQTLAIHPDQYGCAFAQVKPGTYTVAVANAVSGTPAGSTYGSPSFVADDTGAWSGNVWSPSTALPVGGSPSVTVSIGAVSRVSAAYVANFPGYDQGSSVQFSYASSSAVGDGVTCPQAGTLTCIATGTRSGGAASLAWFDSSVGRWSTASLPSGVTRLTSVACPSSAACLAVGYGTSGAVALKLTPNGSSGGAPSIVADSLPAVTGLASSGAGLTQVVCPSSTTCAAIGTTGTGTGNGVVLGATVGASDSWSSDTLPAGTLAPSSLTCPSTTACAAIAATSPSGAATVLSGPAVGTWTAPTLSNVTLLSLSALSCPSTTACLATGLGTIGAGTPGPIAIYNSAGTLGGAVTWSPANLPGTVTGLNSLTCPSAAKCLLVGTGTASGLTGAIVIYGAPGQATLAAEVPTVSSAAASSLSAVTCPTSSQCLAIGANGTTPVLFSGAIAGATTADTWTSASVPVATAGLTLTGLACSTATTCVVGATDTAAAQPQGHLFTTTNGTSWTDVATAAVQAAFYLSGVACGTGSTSSPCTAVGAGPNGAVALTAPSGPGSTWSTGTPTGLTGNAAGGIPVEINNSGLPASSQYINAIKAGSGTPLTSLPLLYPFAGGYGIWAGDCQQEATTYNVAVASTVPGGTSGLTSGMPVPTLPLGVVRLAVTHSSGAVGTPYVAVAPTLTTSTCGTTDTYTLQTTGTDGLSTTEVPYGTYTLSIAGSSKGTLTVGADTVALGAATAVSPAPLAVGA